MHIQMPQYNVSKENQRNIDILSNRAIVFVVPGRVKIGVQPNEIRFPYMGELVDIYATCRFPGKSDTHIIVEKISDKDFRGSSSDAGYVGWEEVSRITLAANERIIDSNLVLQNTSVALNDHFRVVVDELGTDVEDITLEVMIKMNFL